MFAYIVLYFLIGLLVQQSFDRHVDLEEIHFFQKNHILREFVIPVLVVIFWPVMIVLSFLFLGYIFLF